MDGGTFDYGGMTQKQMQEQIEMLKSMGIQGDEP
jgi:hypothetical protein